MGRESLWFVFSWSTLFYFQKFVGTTSDVLLKMINCNLLKCNKKTQQKRNFTYNQTFYWGRETNGGSPSALGHFPADIWRFGRLVLGLLAPGTFPGQDIWLLDLRRWNTWRLEIWRHR